MDKLLRAYIKTLYKTIEEPFVNIRIDKNTPELDRYLKVRNFESWAFITAANPMSKDCDQAFNEKKNRELEDQLRKNKIEYIKAQGIPEDEDWEVEDSFLVFGISLDVVTSLARLFNQKAIVFGKAGGKAELIMIQY